MAAGRLSEDGVTVPVSEHSLISAEVRITRCIYLIYVSLGRQDNLEHVPAPTGYLDKSCHRLRPRRYSSAYARVGAARVHAWHSRNHMYWIKCSYVLNYTNSRSFCSIECIGGNANNRLYVAIVGRAQDSSPKSARIIIVHARFLRIFVTHLIMMRRSGKPYLQIS